MKRTIALSLLITLTLFENVPSAFAQQTAEIQAVLESPILAPGTPLKEIKAFIEPRIPAPPKAKDRAAWEQEASRLRRDMLEQIVFRGTASAWRDAECRVEWLDDVAGGPGYSIRKLRFEALPGMWIPALLYRPDKLEGKVPLALHVNGHAPEGKAVDYKQLRSINLAKRGILVLDLEWFGMGQLRTPGFSHYRLNQLDLCGASGLAPFYLAMKRGLDLGLKLEHVDPARVVVSGLSGGGWQTILISSLDERVTLANPVAGYGGLRTNILFDDMGDSEQIPTDMALVGDYTHLTALRAPRPTLLTYNAGDDCCFQSGHTLEPLLSAARPVFALFGAEDRLRSHVNKVPGTHNFEQDNREQHYAAIGDSFYAGDASFRRTEIPSTAELKTAEQLHAPLPAENKDFHAWALRLAEPLPRDGQLPTDRAAAEKWQLGRRQQLIARLKVPSYAAAAGTARVTTRGQYRITSVPLTIGVGWTVPVIEVVKSAGTPGRTVIVIADAGRASLAAEVVRRAAAGDRVLAVDPLLWGESKIKSQDPDYLYPLFVAGVGERPLGIQAAQLAAVARWSRGEHLTDNVTVSAVGPRSSMAALVAAAVVPEAIAGVELSGGLSSLKQLLDEDHTVETLPELFAFGLLQDFDVCQMAALVAPRPLVFRSPSERTRRDLAPLSSWFGLWGAAFEVSP